ncbi:bifunctional riboflavin kinase/FAD synthetase [Blastopirellula retiformator]|uniref:Riboflavin biosynthesis protein n=1 Tax=Blastopirellula retiformator TaxID=2527970 RepID=A0A5C5V2L5_9BACT|nr:bifunctional riboflavin kinase/FAD synthetase [Blastopirellula retiformator]TWT31962.1 Riboflavin kinase [Blastopirellula retiformator]
MRLLHDLEHVPSEILGGALTIGNFDGVHRGHARIVEAIRRQARAVQGPTIVFTFDPHPVRLLRPQQTPPPLTWTRRKAQLLAQLGVDAMIAYPTDRALLELSAEDFFQQIVVDKLQAKAMVEGPNFYFGRDRRGNTQLLGELCQQHALELEIVQPLELPGDAEIISSSRVRQAIAAGEIETARRMLTEPYRLRGMVTHGAGRGNTLGFATANLEAIDTIVPAHGVYAGYVVRKELTHAAAIHIGPNPTFGEGHPKVEAHLLDFEGSLYGEPLELAFLARLRDVRTFDDAEQLTSQIHQDVEAVKRAYSDWLTPDVREETK